MIAGVKIEGVKKLARKFKGVWEELERENRILFRSEANTLKRLMRSRAPKRTGALMNALVTKKWKDKKGAVGWVVGITHETSIANPQFRVGKDKEYYYPASQEYGWNGHPGHPYIRPTWDARKNKIKSRAKKMYREVIDKAGK